MNRNIAIFASGRGSNFVAIVRACREGRLDATPVVCVCDRPDAPVVAEAARLGIRMIAANPETFDSKRDYEAFLAERLRRMEVSLICLAGYMRIVGRELLSAFPGRIINIHPSVLPAFRGRDAIRRAFETGTDRYGVTVHRVDSGVDTGPIILQHSFNFTGDDLVSLERKIHEVEHDLYPRAIQSMLDRLEKGAKVLVVGGGGRCHALVDAFFRSEKTGEIYCAPGNPGIAEKAVCIPVECTDIRCLADFAETGHMDLTVVGPEAPIFKGIADEFHRRGLTIFAPAQQAARIEESKLFAKEIMAEAEVATGDFKAFDDFVSAMDYIKGKSLPVVIKYDGPAAGKGVEIVTDLAEAEAALGGMLVNRRFGSAKVLVEEHLEGREFSLMCFVNGRKVYPLSPARDYKRAFEGDTGPNTGRMGAYSPVDFITPEIAEECIGNIIQPVADRLVEHGTPFVGVLYAGLILTAGGPKVLEFNCRFGDPETEVVLPRLESDLYSFIRAVLNAEDFTPRWSKDYCVGVVMAAKGYPGKYGQCIPLKPLESPKAQFFHMGTAVSSDATLVSAGGRVVIAIGKNRDFYKAREIAREAVERVVNEDCFYRKDIGTIILNGKELAAKIKHEIADIIKEKVDSGRRAPGVALVLVGNDPASASYVAGKARDAEAVGIRPHVINLPAEITQPDLLAEIEKLNGATDIDGIMVQLPLPSHIDENEVITAIRPDKDVDGFHPDNVAAMWLGGNGMVPCTPGGIMRLLDEYKIPIEGKRAVVVGRSMIVGLPVARLLLSRNATVTIAHSLTDNLKDITAMADILVVATGQHGLITSDMLKPGCTVIDVGISRNPKTGRLQGDTEFEKCREIAMAITPVPGGVGPLTKAFLMENTLRSYLSH